MPATEAKCFLAEYETSMRGWRLLSPRLVQCRGAGRRLFALPITCWAYSPPQFAIRDVRVPSSPRPRFDDPSPSARPHGNIALPRTRTKLRWQRGPPGCDKSRPAAVEMVARAVRSIAAGGTCSRRRCCRTKSQCSKAVLDQGSCGCTQTAFTRGAHSPMRLDIGFERWLFGYDPNRSTALADFYTCDHTKTPL